jgi:hypothetical protein
LKKDTVFFRQAALLLRVLPFVNEEEIFAFKGGTAINFFLRDLPRLSVDIDLTYLPVNDRETALTDIDKALLRISERVKKKIAGVRVFPKKDHDLDILAGLLIRRGDATIKIEPNPVLRGSVFPTEMRTLCQRAQGLFELSIEAPAPFHSRIFTEGRPVQLWTGNIRETCSTSICCSRMRGFRRKCARPLLFILSVTPDRWSKSSIRNGVTFARSSRENFKAWWSNRSHTRN